MRPRGGLAAAALVCSLLPGISTALPAAAASTSRITIAASPSTAHVGSVVVVTGVVTPHTSAPVEVQRLVGHTWKALAHSRSSKAGGYMVSLRAPVKAATWQLRVVEPGAATSRSVRVHVVKAIFTVRAAATPTVAYAKPIVVTGTVTPKATGSVALQRFQHKGWHNLATSKLSRTSTFTFSTTQPTGAYRLRVVKAFTTSVAAGTSKTLAVSVAGPVTSPPPTPPATPAPVVTTARLPIGTLGFRYLVQLQASGGTLPLTWAITTGTLPAGLLFSAAGRIIGTPTTAGTSTLTVTVTDASGRSASLPLALIVQAGVVRDWGAVGSSPALANGLTGVVAVAAGFHTSYAVLADGSLWAWGDGTGGQLGDGLGMSSATPVRVANLTGVVAAAGGSESAYALKADGTVWAWGDNAAGELGNGSTANSLVPVQVTSLTGVVGIAALTFGAYALTSDGSVWSWGPGIFGDLGNGTSSVPSTTPVRVSGISTAIAIAASQKSGYAVLADGTIAAWGFDNVGQLGDDSPTTERDTPVLVHGITHAVGVAAAVGVAYGLLADGTAWSWGQSGYGTLGQGAVSASQLPGRLTALSGITAISAAAGFGGGSGYALGSDGRVWSWGDNDSGGLGNGTQTSNGVPTPIPGLPPAVALGAGANSTVGYAVTWS
jgi:Putative Ig domain/Regulator of chromosome condensation (RCC1) repeat